jgi:acyl-CoA synthetase (AMP-forming)/AMP-acid ligase II
VEGTEVRCIRVVDDPIFAWTPDLEVPPGTPGEIAVRGPQVSRRYFARPDADALAKIADPHRGVWHRTGDVGRFDAKGRLWFLGRKSQRVRTAGGDLYADQCEAVFNAHPQVARSALVGVGDPGRQVPHLWVELECGADCGLWTSGTEELLAEFPPVARAEGSGALAVLRREAAPNPRFFLPIGPGRMPVDSRHNAKIQREAMAARATSRPRGDLA